MSLPVSPRENALGTMSANRDIHRWRLRSHNDMLDHISLKKKKKIEQKHHYTSTIERFSMCTFTTNWNLIRHIWSSSPTVLSFVSSSNLTISSALYLPAFSNCMYLSFSLFHCANLTFNALTHALQPISTLALYVSAVDFTPLHLPSVDFTPL